MSSILHHDAVTATDDAAPERWLYVLHGIYGAGRNWASVARRIVRRRPDWGALLVDLRQHGSSQGFAPPHTVAAAAADLDDLATSSGIRPGAVLGHSFGGKVALLFAGGDSSAAAGLGQVWVIDSTPEAREPEGSAWTMLNLLRSMPDHYASRTDLVDTLVRHGIARAVAQWMASNLEATGGVYRWRFDLHAMEELLRSFFGTDAWSVVESPRAGLDVHLVKAEESGVLSGAALQRCERAAEQAHTHLHRVTGGHWVNADNPEAIERLLVQKLPG
jgi:esterase